MRYALWEEFGLAYFLKNIQTIMANITKNTKVFASGTAATTSPLIKKRYPRGVIFWYTGPLRLLVLKKNDGVPNKVLFRGAASLAPTAPRKPEPNTKA
ncbi:hypothetical protein [Candidatus Uabimicrobium amorphum]|uniref:hypothetical protein n=1 Tax=Uabimicrobium amorphum TaxID=2596890 RepID=UPI00125EC628|nr:hypothetical protein [Candidatus Uabimicrobium amorphum]